ncbi:Na/Pi symporter, partial [Cecembia lonarensis]|uniref:Na/Pi symporter n=1 Tax=Cecembia lonarensis TaxID=645110 RepID=UPI00058F50F9
MSKSIKPRTYSNKVIPILITLFGLLFFMFSIDLLTVSMTQINNDFASQLFVATNNPFVGLFIGLLMTALIQSSSTVTAMVVAVVASGSLTLGQAVPVVMGANIGTTITSTLVAFSFIMKKNVFKKALAAGVLHDVFNILTVLVLFPLEVYFGFLSESASYLTATFFDLGDDFDGSYAYNVLFTRPLTLWLVNLLQQPVIALILAVVLVFVSIKFLSQAVMRAFMSDNLNKINKHIFQKPFLSFAYGAFFTAAVQSSTVTTSIMVPAVANRKVSLVKAFPFIIGANIGTTITASIAAIYKTDAAISLAIVHVMFNLFGALLFMPSASIRNIPVKIATFLGNESIRTRFVGFAYILLTFFVIPFLLIYFNKDGDIHEMSQAHKQPKT